MKAFHWGVAMFLVLMIAAGTPPDIGKLLIGCVMIGAGLALWERSA